MVGIGKVKVIEIKLADPMTITNKDTNMKYVIKIKLCLLVFSLLSANSVIARNFIPQDKIERVQIASELYEATFNEKKGEELGRFYKKNAVLKLPGAFAILGKDAIVITWEEGFNNGVESLELTAGSFEALGRRQVVESGTYILNIATPDELIEQVGTYSVLWYVPRNPYRHPKIIFDTIDLNRLDSPSNSEK
jgi:hypothetical protein